MKTMKTLQEIYKSRNPKGCWFDSEAINFFNSKFDTSANYSDEGTVFFISSEKPPYGNRRYSVNAMDETGCIRKIGKSCEYTKIKANKILKAVEEKGFTGLEHVSTRYIVHFINVAKEAFEKAGIIDDDFKTAKANAEYWAKDTRIKLDWSTGLHPAIKFDNREYPLESFKRFMMLDLFA